MLAASTSFAAIAVLVKSVTVEDWTWVPLESDTPLVLMELVTVGIAVPPVATRQSFTVTVSAVVLSIDQLEIVQAIGTVR